MRGEECQFSDLYAIPSKNGLMAPRRVRGRGIRLVNMAEIFSLDTIQDQQMELAPVPEATYASWLLKPGDLLFARQSLTLAGAGRCVMVADHSTPMTFESHIIRVRLDRGVANPRYWYYFFRSPSGRGLMSTIVDQVGAAGIRASDLGRLRVTLPPLPEQERIAGVLGAFDDLIETNLILASQLDSVVFAHVRAAAEGAPTVSFGEVATRVTDKVASHEMHEGQPYLGLEHFGTDGIGLIGRGTTNGITSTSSAFRKGDVLYGKLRPYFRKVSRPGFDGVCSAEVWVLRAKGGHSQAVLHTIAHSQAFSDAAVAGSGGTRMPRADWKHLSSLQVPDLRQMLGEREEAALDSLWQAACDLRAETDELTQQRDALLPLLMSGKVRVSESEGVA